MIDDDPPDPLFLGAWLKWGQAVVHTQTLEIDVETFSVAAHDKPLLTLRTEYHPKRHGFAVIVDSVVVPIPVRWGLLLGDIANNYRSSLDHVAWALVVRGSIPPSTLKPKSRRDIQFPIKDKRTEFNGELPRRLPGVNADRKGARAPVENGSTLSLKLLGDLRLVHRLAACGIGCWLGAPGSSLGVLEPVALALGLDDVAAVSEPVEGRPGEALGAEDFCPGLEGQIARDDQARALIGGRDDVEEQFGADLGGRDVSEFVKHEQVQSRELSLQFQECPLVSCLDERGHELGGAKEPDLVALVARLGGECRGQVGLARAGVADHQNVLPFVDVLTTRQLGDQHLVDRRAGREVEALEGLDGREPCRLQPSFGRAFLPVQQLEFQELQQVGEVVDVVGPRLFGDLLALGADGRQSQGLQVMVQ